jgi:two-component system phosphate regulon sensor histidine kinase PhoR
VNVRLFFRTLFAFTLLIVAAAAILFFSLENYWRNTLTQEAERNLRQKTALFAQRVEAEGQHALRDVTSQQGQTAGARATVIDFTGKVLADSEAEPSSMSDVLSRPEFVEALQGRIGTSTRSGNRVGVPVLSVAVPIQGGAVRLAYPLADVETSLASLHRRLWLVSGASFLLALAISFFFARTLVRSRPPQETAEYRAPVSAAWIQDSPTRESPHKVGMTEPKPRADEEPLTTAPNNQQQLETLLNSMQDAVIAVGPDGRVAWANQEMRELTQRVRLQAPLVETVRDPELLRAMREADKNGSRRSRHLDRLG